MNESGPNLNDGQADESGRAATHGDELAGGQVDRNQHELDQSGCEDHSPSESSANTPKLGRTPGDQMTPGDQAPWQRLDRRWIGLTRSVEVAVWAGLGLAALIAGPILLMTAPFPFPWIVITVWSVLAIVALFRTIWWPRLVYDHWSYRVGQKVFELRYGILWTVSVSIPLSRLQHVDLHRGPLERHRGLASLQVHTAGTKEASQLIPGLDFDVAQSLRDRLIDAANRGGRGKHASTQA